MYSSPQNKKFCHNLLAFIMFRIHIFSDCYHFVYLNRESSQLTPVKLAVKKGVRVVMNETHLSMFHSVLNRARGKRSRNSVSSAASYAFNSLF